MTIYYIFLGVFGVFVLVVIVIGGIGMLQNRRLPLEKRVELVRNRLLDLETETGSSHYPAGAVSRVSDDMIIEIAESEGFKLVNNGHYRIAFQRRVVPGRE